MAAFPDWEVKLLRAIGAPATPENLRFLSAWQRAEGGTASFNPLNTTQPFGGASNYNSVGVKNYPSATAGLEATAKTLTNGYYGPIVSLLRRGRASAVDLAKAVASSPWGTGGGVLRVLGSSDAGSSKGRTPGSEPGNGGSTPSPAAPFSDGVNALLSGFLLQQAQNTLQGHPSDATGLLGLALTRSQLEAANRQFGPEPGTETPGTRTLQTAKSRKVGAIPGVAEAFYDPLGSYDSGRFGGPIGGHSNHVHVSDTSPTGMLAAIRLAQNMGLTVRENPYVDPVDPVHVQRSFHYRTFPGTYNGRKLGEAIDASGSPDLMAEFFRRITQGLK